MKRYVKEFAMDAMKEIDKQTNIPKPLREENKGRIEFAIRQAERGMLTDFETVQYMMKVVDIAKYM